MVRSLTVVLDGWGLSYRPDSPEAVHLWALLENLPPGLNAILAVPTRFAGDLPVKIETKLIYTPDTTEGRLRWEQLSLPKIARQRGADLIHLTSGTAPFFAKTPTVFSPAGEELTNFIHGKQPEPRPPIRYGGLAARMRQALLPAGFIRTRGIIWPADLPPPTIQAPIYLLPTIVPHAFDEGGEPEWVGTALPESFILYHAASSEVDSRRFLAAWSWAAPAIGANYPLLVVGVRQTERLRLAALVNEYQLGETVQILPELSLARLAAIYTLCSAFFSTGPVSPWGDSLSLALACAKPIVALYTQWADARLGPAAYLVQPGNSFKAASRALGAALVTVAVEESVAEYLSTEAMKRSAAWKTTEPGIRDLLDQYLRQSSREPVEKLPASQ